ncbi:MAG: serine/threonine protein kinase [Planctomycetes bacterium]|nr:serine/threonine protein kinase [Planctomycetota bacterium]
MGEQDAEQVFAQIASQKGFLSEDQIEECRRIYRELASSGEPRQSLVRIAYDRGYLSREQLQEFRDELRERGIYPRMGGYELIEKLGRGSMGLVYKANQLSLQRTVALKILEPKYFRDDKYVERFRQEALLAAKLNHSNAVQIYDVEQIKNRHFIVMEYIDGESVRKVLKRGRIPERRSLEIVRDISNALGKAHEKGIIHRDIKPANILINSDGVPKISDLGLAKDMSAGVGEDIEETSMAVGTPRFMSPEQCRGETDIDRRSDIYSLGITLFEMVCGDPPFTAPTRRKTIEKHVHEPLPNPGSFYHSLSDGTCRLLKKMTSKDPDDRVQRCDELVDLIEAILVGGGIPEALKVVTRPRSDQGEEKASDQQSTGAVMGKSDIRIDSSHLKNARESQGEKAKSAEIKDEDLAFEETDFEVNVGKVVDESGAQNGGEELKEADWDTTGAATTPGKTGGTRSWPLSLWAIGLGIGLVVLLILLVLLVIGAL